ncbi:hypothetical protein [Pseudorhodoplanes sinuspersici]|uniref:Uncharacterized protein n=1 Tax=Pseudorhodoplanes sinuspersici TaxID=1235591 RepID=A0A1W6ZMZ4_9HYPH|nr:hypothetical protein [Pseudorhodoplanes sinuspersici]ARP98729.1 hypothetical protein CAK95_06285 [Pseudorhodoplanes sinuspersici]RKE69666.1 hypothetical protein DFP91_4105 [Pseudorhodoplanes sinuspersici]
MRKTALVLALAVAVAPTAALAKKSAKAPAAKAAKAAPADLNANGKKFVMTAFSQPYLAWKSVWAPEAAPAKAKAKKK